MKIKTFRPLSASEKKAVALLKKLDKLAAEPDFNASIFGFCGYKTALILGNHTDEIREYESRHGCIKNDTIAWYSSRLIGDGGDPNSDPEYRNA